MGGSVMGMVMILALAASILMGCTDVALGLNEAEKIHVGGRVLCQDCTQEWNKWAYGGKPIKGCKVSAICMDERRRIVHYASDTTDELGEFQLIIDKLVNGKQIKTELCSVRLVSSPDPTCNVFTNFGNGVSGVKLFRQLATAFNDNFIKYSLNPFYFTTPMCDQPDTTSSSTTTPSNSNQYVGNNNNNY
ncbi:uncharacterized protein LOC107432058 [Ziziphus jujuba]|uniref:Uncharacterized protein LOC107432058 n=1 Tax=Ziziphus jujuba TaxID=326968 RepID=A0A6P4BHM4_ZIZJJ|nr:uncharacterized protein LOC107432058 [Ziziphus jujuba]